MSDQAQLVSCTKFQENDPDPLVSQHRRQRDRATNRAAAAAAAASAALAMREHALQRCLSDSQKSWSRARISVSNRLRRAYLGAPASSPVNKSTHTATPPLWQQQSSTRIERSDIMRYETLNISERKTTATGARATSAYAGVTTAQQQQITLVRCARLWRAAAACKRHKRREHRASRKLLRLHAKLKAHAACVVCDRYRTKRTERTIVCRHTLHIV